MDEKGPDPIIEELIDHVHKQDIDLVWDKKAHHPCSRKYQAEKARTGGVNRTPGHAGNIETWLKETISIWGS